MVATPYSGWLGLTAIGAGGASLLYLSLYLYLFL